MISLHHNRETTLTSVTMEEFISTTGSTYTTTIAVEKALFVAIIVI
jgi:hypothetical protein